MSSPLFNIIILLLILANTYSLADYTFDESAAYADRKAVYDYIFVIAFTLELALKLLGLGFHRFFQDKFNVFDAMIVLISLIDVIISQIKVDESNLVFHVLTVLRACRTIRLLKLARYNAGMRQLLIQTKRSLQSIGGFSLMLLLFIFIWALLGMELFAYKAVTDEEGVFINPE